MHLLTTVHPYSTLLRMKLPECSQFLLFQDKLLHNSHPGGYQKRWDRGCERNPCMKKMIPERHSPPSRYHRSWPYQYPLSHPTESQRPAHQELSRCHRLPHTTLKPVLMRGWKRSDLTRTAIYPGMLHVKQPGNSACPLRSQGQDRWLPHLSGVLPSHSMQEDVLQSLRVTWQSSTLMSSSLLSILRVKFIFTHVPFVLLHLTLRLPSRCS